MRTCSFPPEQNGMLDWQLPGFNKVAGLQMYGHNDIGRLLADETPQAYLAQQVSSWAPILLPRPWRHFVSWWEDERAWLPMRHYLNGSQIGPSPCLPGLASNQWWAKAPDTMWTVWWHRFAVVTGYVVLYQDPRTGPAQAVNHKEPGEHFKVKQGATGDLPGRLSAGHSEPSHATLAQAEVALAEGGLMHHLIASGSR